MAEGALDHANADLNLVFSDATVSTSTEDGFSELWGGARALVGSKSGRHYFKVTLHKFLPAKATDPGIRKALHKLDIPDRQSALKVGISYDSCQLSLLGLTPQSWCYCSHGKLQGLNQVGSGELPEIEEGDEVGCFVDVSSSEIVVSFSKNGEWLGESFRIPRPASTKDLIFPHVVLKNAKATLKCSGLRVNEHRPWQAIDYRQKSAKSDSLEAIFVAGLPGCGKTQWSEEYALGSASKHHLVVNVQLILSMLQIYRTDYRSKALESADFALLRRWAADLALKLLPAAAKRQRNFIIDHNSLGSAEGRAKCIQPFRKPAFQCKAAAVMQDLVKQLASQKKSIASGSYSSKDYLDAQAAFSLPRQNEGFIVVMYPREKMNSSERIVEAMQKEMASQKRAVVTSSRAPTDGSSVQKRPRVEGSSASRVGQARSNRHGIPGGGRAEDGQHRSEDWGLPEPRLGPHLHPSDLNLAPRPPAGLKPGYVHRNGNGQFQQNANPSGYDANPHEHRRPVASGSLLSSIVTGDGFNGPPGFQDFSVPAVRFPGAGEAQTSVGPPGFDSVSPMFRSNPMQGQGLNSGLEKLPMQGGNRGGERRTETPSGVPWGTDSLVQSGRNLLGEGGHPSQQPQNLMPESRRGGGEPYGMKQGVVGHIDRDTSSGPPGFEQPIARRTHNTLFRPDGTPAQPFMKNYANQPYQPDRAMAEQRPKGYQEHKAMQEMQAGNPNIRDGAGHQAPQQFSHQAVHQHGTTSQSRRLEHAESHPHPMGPGSHRPDSFGQGQPGQFDRPPAGQQYDHPAIAQQYDRPPAAQQYDHPPAGQPYDHPPAAQQYGHPPVAEQYDRPPAGQQFDRPPAGQQQGNGLPMPAPRAQVSSQSGNYRELSDVPQPRNITEQRKLDAWQRGKEDRVGYMSPALPGHISSHSTHHQQAFHLASRDEPQAEPTAGPDAFLQRDLTANPNYSQHIRQTQNNAGWERESRPSAAQPSMQRRQRGQAPPMAAQGPPMAAQYPPPAQSSELAGMGHESPASLKPPRTGVVSEPKLVAGTSKALDYSSAKLKPSAASVRKADPAKAPGWAKPAARPPKVVAPVEDDTNQVAAAVYGHDPMQGHMHGGTHPSHHGGLGHAAPFLHQAPYQEHYGQPDMEGNQVFAGYAHSQDAQTAGHAFAPPLPPDYYDPAQQSYAHPGQQGEVHSGGPDFGQHAAAAGGQHVHNASQVYEPIEDVPWARGNSQGPQQGDTGQQFAMYDEHSYYAHPDPYAQQPPYGHQQPYAGQQAYAGPPSYDQSYQQPNWN